jgi:hypothetical protein
VPRGPCRVSTDFAQHHAVQKQVVSETEHGIHFCRLLQTETGCEQALLELVRGHLLPLRAEGLVTTRESIVVRAADGTVIEIFGWVSPEAITGAHSNPVVLELWKKLEAVCTYEIPCNVAEFRNMFAHFEPV